MHEAILKSDEGEVTRILDENPELLAPDLWPVTIFEAKSTEVTRLLLNRGLDPNACSAPRRPLHLAVYRCIPDIVELLIERGADVNFRNSLGEVPMDLLDAYEPRPVCDPDTDRIFRALRNAGAEVTLEAIIRRGRLDEVRPMLDRNPEFATSDSELGGPLFSAARSGRPEIAWLLIEFGADPDKVNSKGNTPVWVAAQSPASPASSRVAVMKILLESGADVNRRCEDGTTALHLAAWRGPAEVVMFLLMNGARNWLRDDRGQTSLDLARTSESEDREEIIKLLGEVRIENPLLRAAVTAIDQGNVEELQQLLCNHPELIDVRAEEDGGFAGTYFRKPKLLHFVANNPYRSGEMTPRILESTQAILNAGADVHAKTEGENGHTVLGLVTSCEPARKAGVQIPLIEMLVGHGADPGEGLDPAIIQNENEAVECLLGLGARQTLMSAAALGDAEALSHSLSLNHLPEQLESAAFAAAMYGQIPSVEKLLETGIQINQRHSSHPYSPTLLHQAAWFGRDHLVAWLLDRGADPTIKDSQFEGTPADWAKENKHFQLAEKLTRAAAACP